MLYGPSGTGKIALARIIMNKLRLKYVFVRVKNALKLYDGNIHKSLIFDDIFTTKNSKVEADMKNTADKYIKTAGLEELMRVNDGGRNVKISVKSGATDSQIRELLMYVDGAKKDETVLLSLTGNFDINEISVLTDKMQLPGGADLKKASKGKK